MVPVKMMVTDKWRKWLARAGHPAHSRGMTLVELLAVAVMLSFITSAVLMLYSQSWHASHKDDRQLKAGHIAQLVLEEWLAAQDYEQIRGKMGMVTLTTANDDILREIWDNNPEYQPYKPQVELAYADATRNSGPIRVTVTIETQGTGPRNPMVTLHGIKAETAP